MIVGGLLRLNQPSYRQSPSIRSRGPPGLCAQGPVGTDFSVLPELWFGGMHQMLRLVPSVTEERVREMDLSGQKAGRRSWITTRAAEGRGLVRRFAFPSLHRTALLKAPKIKYPP